jgi:hypothetical protein
MSTARRATGGLVAWRKAAEGPASAELASYAAEYAAAARAGDGRAAGLLRNVESYLDMLPLAGTDMAEIADLFLTFAREDYGPWKKHQRG